MTIPSFNFASIPHIIFGFGKRSQLFEIINRYGKKVLVVTGKKSLQKSGKWDEIVRGFEANSINYFHLSISGEPSPDMIDNAVSQFRDKKLDLVIGIGGGSVTDSGKAVSAMIPQEDSIKEYLEGVGTKKHNGKKIPYIAIPTTSGTGSEATKNAVISKIGPSGFKKSLRHENLIPNYAIIDPELMLTCPNPVTGACGMDAFTQLLEAYISSRANPITDALAFSGMKYMKDAIIPVSTTNPKDINLRTAMAYGSLLSGICLANAGLGIVHGLASPIGSFFEIPHGVVCGTLLAESIKMNIKKMKKNDPTDAIGLEKYARIGSLISGKEPFNRKQVDKYCASLVNILEKWTKQLHIDRLEKYGISKDEVYKIAKRASLKNNPVSLTTEEIQKIIENRI